MKAYIVVHYVLDFEQFSGGVKSTRCRATVQPDNHIAVEWWYDEKDGEWRDDAECLDGEYVITRSEAAAIARVMSSCAPVLVDGKLVYGEGAP